MDSTWMDQARCAGLDGEEWFPEAGTPMASAKQICAACPVRQRCLEFALEHGMIRYGLFGGTTVAERKKMPHKSYRSPLCAAGHWRAQHEFVNSQGYAKCAQCDRISKGREEVA